MIYFASSWVLDSYQLRRDLGLDRRPEPPLDHQERAGLRPDGRRPIAGIAAWLQVATILMWGQQTKRFPLMTLDWPEEAAKIEGKERDQAESDDAPTQSS